MRHIVQRGAEHERSRVSTPGPGSGMVKLGTENISHVSCKPSESEGEDQVSSIDLSIYLQAIFRML